MEKRTISVVALSNRDFPSFEDKLREATQWMEVAALQGADLAVLPEYLNVYRGDGWDNPAALSLEEAALDDWQTATAMLFEAAVRLGMAIAIPVLTREGDHLTNSFFLVSAEGTVLGRYQKRQPTENELAHGVVPGQHPLIDWEGLKVGGAICFDANFPRIFDQQARAGAQLFLAPSLGPGGDQLNYYALRYSAPIALAYPAWSRIIDLDGRDLVAGGYRYETLRFGFGSPVYTATLNFDRVRLHSDHNQEKMREVQLAYGRKVGLRFDQQNASFYLESLSPDVSVEEIIREFDLLRLDDFLSRFPMSD